MVQCFCIILGVWGLDDFQFLSYYWGSSQLIGHKNILPKSILQRDIVDYFSKDYMYLACIKFILDVKKGPFFEHSPMVILQFI
jgi:serine/threonine-protein phosphatase 2A activator